MEITILPDKYQKDLCKSNYDLQKVYKHHRREYTLKEQTNELLSSKSSPNTHVSFVKNFYMISKKDTVSMNLAYGLVSKVYEVKHLGLKSYLPRYGALYDKLPLHAFVSRTEDLEPEKFLPLDTLQIWDCFSYDIAIIQKAFLRNLSCKFYAKDKQMYGGDYMFTVDNASPDLNIIDTSYSEWPEDHKSFNFIQLDNGQYAAQPNNRCLFFDAASNPKENSVPRLQSLH